MFNERGERTSLCCVEVRVRVLYVQQHMYSFVCVGVCGVKKRSKVSMEGIEPSISSV